MDYDSFNIEIKCALKKFLIDKYHSTYHLRSLLKKVPVQEIYAFQIKFLENLEREIPDAKLRDKIKNLAFEIDYKRYLEASPLYTRSLMPIAIGVSEEVSEVKLRYMLSEGEFLRISNEKTLNLIALDRCYLKRLNFSNEDLLTEYFVAENTLFEELNFRSVSIGKGGLKIISESIDKSLESNRIPWSLLKNNQCSINLDYSHFKGKVLININYSNKIEADKKNIRFVISLNHATFEGAVSFDLPLADCPDFSKAHFLKGVIIEETWPKITEINAADEEKFRFLKNYFAKTNNHLKEQEYFRYEMLARAKSLKGELRRELENLKKAWREELDCRVALLLAMTKRFFTKLENKLLAMTETKLNFTKLKNKLLAMKRSLVPSSQEAQPSTPSLRGAKRRGNPLALTNFLKINLNQKTRKIYWQRYLIKRYENLSKFGSSIALPLYWLIAIWIVFASIYNQFFCSEVRESLLASLIKTLVPIANIKDLFALEQINLSLNLIATLHGLLSAIFIFLFLLAIRNRFKIK